MNSESWQRVKVVFHGAAELPPDRRGAYLSEHCGNDDELRREVESLLAAADTSERTAVAGDFESTLPASEGATIGPYRLVKRLGEGGFGAVYLAEQQSPIVRQVALKIIKLGMDTRQVIARFDAERQALSILNHPNVARVLDAGATDTGRPYFVMEWVDGVPITDYCDTRRLGVRQRMELLIPVCQAVQHAHQKGIIHRDLKPGNVLVTEVDGRPVPKVIDFGIAKAIDQRLTEQTVFTREAQMIGTPAYMSPEQAGGETDIDTRTDVYSLGVLMYELLTGVTPFDGETLRSAAYHEIQRIVREFEPPRPSARLSGLEALASIAATRDQEPSKLLRKLRGELDWIVMKCLEKDRTRRYDTAAGLAADVQRYLNDEPVTARPPSRAYRASKFIRRHRVPIAAATAITTLTLAGGVFYIRSMNAERSRTLAALESAREQSERATRQAAIAEAVSQFQQDLFSSADPDHASGHQVTVVQSMSAAVVRLDQGALKDQPLVEAAVRWEIGQTLLSLADYDRARANFVRAEALSRAHEPRPNRMLARALNSLGLVDKILERRADSEKSYREALDIRRRDLPEGHAEIAVTLNNLASLLQDTGRTLEAEAMYRESLSIRRALAPPIPLEVAQTLNNLASLLLQTGKREEGAVLLGESLELRRQHLRPDHPQVAQSLNNLAAALRATGKLDDAELLLRESLEMRRRALPAGHPDIAVTLHNLGSLLEGRRQYAAAEPLLREALAIRRRVLGPRAGPTTRTATVLRDLLKESGRDAEAGDVAQDAGLAAPPTTPTP